MIDQRLINALQPQPQTKKQILPPIRSQSTHAVVHPPLSPHYSLKHPSIYAVTTPDQNKKKTPLSYETKEDPTEDEPITEGTPEESTTEDPEPTDEPTIQPIEPTMNRCEFCTLPLSICKCAADDTIHTTVDIETSDSNSTNTLIQTPPLRGMVSHIDVFCRAIVPFDPDDESKRTRTLSPYLTFFLWTRALIRSATVVSLSIDFETVLTTTNTTNTIQWWTFYPAYPLSQFNATAVRPIASICYEIFYLLILLLQFNRNVRKYLFLRPLLGAISTIVLVLDTVSIITLVTQTDSTSVSNMVSDVSVNNGYAFIDSFNNSTIGFIIVLQSLNVVTWFVAAHIVLAHDRTNDGDTDGTDRVEEISGGGASGIGISSYRQEQLIFVRAAIWPDAPPMPLTPIPFRVYLMIVGGVFASIIASLLFWTKGSPVIYSMHALRVNEMRMTNSNTILLPSSIDSNISLYFKTWLGNQENNQKNVSSILTAFEKEMLTQLLTSSTKSVVSPPPPPSPPLTTFLWDDPRLMFGVSIFIGVLSTIIQLKNELHIFIRHLRGLRHGKIPFTNTDRNINYLDTVPAMAATGLLGWSIGWHFSVQLMVSSGVAVLYEMLALSVKAYSNIETSLISLPAGTFELFVVSIVSFVALYLFERYVFGAHRCLRPRHLLSCIELSFMMLYSICAMLFAICYMLYLIATRNICITPLLVDTSPLIQSILVKAAENYERNNNSIVRFTSILMRRTGIGQGIEWDKDFVPAELTLSAQETATNASLRLFWFLIENPSLIMQQDTSDMTKLHIKHLQHGQRILKSFENLLSQNQIQMLQVAFDLLDSDLDGYVTLRDLKCAQATIPELLNLEMKDLFKIIDTISIETWNEKEKEREKENEKEKQSQVRGFNFIEWVSFLRHRLFLCDMSHHGLGAKDVRLYGIELRKLRGQLEGALKIQSMKRSESIRMEGMGISPIKRTAEMEASKIKKLKEREKIMLDKAIAISGTISETEMAFWGAKIPEDLFELLAERIGCSKSNGDTNDGGNEDSILPTVLIQRNKLRPFIRACLGTKQDHAIGDLLLDSLQGGGHTATQKSLRTSYILAHSTGWRLTHLRSGDNDWMSEDDEEEVMEEKIDDDVPSFYNSRAKEKPLMTKQKKTKTKSNPKKEGKLGAEKQLLSFVSRGLMPHTY